MMSEYIDRMNDNPKLQKYVSDTIAMGKKYGIHNRQHSTAGWGVFTTKQIPPNTKVLVYVATIHHAPLFKKDNTYCFQSILTPPGSFTPIPVVFDAKPSIDAIKREYPMTESQKQLAKINGGFNNHSCAPNMYPKWVNFGVTSPSDDGDWLISYTTLKKPIAAGSELLSNYNGEGKGHHYFTKFSTLVKRGTPDHAIVECMCGSSKKGLCPNNYAFDRDIMEGRITHRAPAAPLPNGPAYAPSDAPASAQ